jgi:hypothetical protein
MTVDNQGNLNQSNVGNCNNYNPDKTRPTGVKANDVPGLLIYKCLNCEPTKEGKRINYSCGDTKYCAKYEAKIR